MWRPLEPLSSYMRMLHILGQPSWRQGLYICKPCGRYEFKISKTGPREVHVSWVMISHWWGHLEMTATPGQVQEQWPCRKATWVWSCSPLTRWGSGASTEPSGLGISHLKTADNRSTYSTGLQLWLDSQILYEALKAWGKSSRNVSCCYPADFELPSGHDQQQPQGAMLLIQPQSLSAFLFFPFCGSWFAFLPQTGGPLVLISQAVPGRWMRGLQAAAVGSSPHSHSPILSRLYWWSQHIWSDREKRQAALRHSPVGSSTPPAAESAMDFWAAVSQSFDHSPDLGSENEQGQEMDTGTGD